MTLSEFARAVSHLIFGDEDAWEKVHGDDELELLFESVKQLYTEPAAPDDNISIRVEQGTEPWTYTVTVYDAAGIPLRRFVNHRVDDAPWFVRLCWKAEGKLRTKIRENVEERARKR